MPLGYSTNMMRRKSQLQWPVGTALAQKGKKAALPENKSNKKEDEDEEPKKKPYANKECFVCGKKGQGGIKCPS